MQERQAVVKELDKGYRQKTKKERGLIVDELVYLTGYNRSYACRVLRSAAYAGRREPRKRSRAKDLRPRDPEAPAHDLGHHGRHFREEARPLPLGRWPPSWSMKGNSISPPRSGRSSLGSWRPPPTASWLQIASAQ